MDQINNNEIHEFLLPYRSRVYDPFELMAKIRQTFRGWEDSDKNLLILTFKLKDILEDKEVYGVSEEIMNMLGAWKSPMSGKNWWVNPTNPDSRSYADVHVNCPSCNRRFCGARSRNEHEDGCTVSYDVYNDLREERIDWLRQSSYYLLDIEIASRRLGVKSQTVQDLIWETDDLSYSENKKRGLRVMATTAHIAKEWGTDVSVISEATGYSESTVNQYISRYSTVKGNIPRDKTVVR